MSAVDEALAAATVDSRDRKIARLERRVDEAERVAKSCAIEMEREKQRADFALAVSGPFDVEPIRPISAKGKVREAASFMTLSDTHFEERVRPETVNGLNKYDIAIAKDRLFEYARGIEWYHRLLTTGDVRYRIRQGVLGALGDFITGFIHQEYEEENQLSPEDATLLAEEYVCDFIHHIRKRLDLERLVVMWNHGNHDRGTAKVQPSNMARRSFSWIMAHHVRRQFQSDKRIEFKIADGIHLYHDVMGHKIRTTHGDTIRYKDGVGGLSIPANKAIEKWNHGIRADITVHGHLHTIGEDDQRVGNGSLIGYNPFAVYIKAKPEPAAQAVFVIDPDYGKSFFKRIVVQKT